MSESRTDTIVRPANKPIGKLITGTEWRENGELHRDDDQPARIHEDGTREWYQYGKLHRDKDLPAITYPDGSSEWYQYGKHHRGNDRPAIMLRNGLREWYQYGLRHRDNDDQPAVIKADGTCEWYRYGLRHRDNDKPAVVFKNGGVEWWIFGMLHRDYDKPAIDKPDGAKLYYRFGEAYHYGADRKLIPVCKTRRITYDLDGTQKCEEYETICDELNYPGRIEGIETVPPIIYINSKEVYYRTAKELKSKSRRVITDRTSGKDTAQAPGDSAEPMVVEPKCHDGGFSEVYNTSVDRVSGEDLTGATKCEALQSRILPKIVQALTKDVTQAPDDSAKRATAEPTTEASKYHVTDIHDVYNTFVDRAFAEDSAKPDAVNPANVADYHISGTHPDDRIYNLLVDRSIGVDVTGTDDSGDGIGPELCK